MSKSLGQTILDHFFQELGRAFQIGRAGEGQNNFKIIFRQDFLVGVLSKCYTDWTKRYKLSEDKKDRLPSNWTSPIFTLIWFLNFGSWNWKLWGRSSLVIFKTKYICIKLQSRYLWKQQVWSALPNLVSNPQGQFSHFCKKKGTHLRDIGCP